MATHHDPSKHRRYDPSMSRRTRRPIKISQEDMNEESESQLERDEGLQRMSLQELMVEGGDSNSNSSKGEKAGADTDDREGDVRKLTDVSAEEKNAPPAAAPDDGESEKKLAVVLKQGDSASGVTVAGMVSRYVKVLNKLIKARHNSKKRSAAKLMK
ncbi:hypothetical protein OPV22_024557 [Ensete ventricosum]|uniref:Uncharacterized protein n=1 Tax=Ensete ventricosum TaxID=4639 RepID=A0AAV8QAC6_ENSVE|nr:hypothetical protein OPV22_024557 [Ensete ventricosum]